MLKVPHHHTISNLITSNSPHLLSLHRCKHFLRIFLFKALSYLCYIFHVSLCLCWLTSHIIHIHLAQSLKRSSTVSGWSFSPFVSCSIINVGIKNACNMSSNPCTQPGSAAYSSTRMLPRYRKQLCWCLWYRLTICNTAHNLITEVLQPWTHKARHDMTWHDVQCWQTLTMLTWLWFALNS